MKLNSSFWAHDKLEEPKLTELFTSVLMIENFNNTSNSVYIGVVAYLHQGFIYPPGHRPGLCPGKLFLNYSTEYTSVD